MTTGRPHEPAVEAGILSRFSASPAFTQALLTRGEAVQRSGSQESGAHG
jgi:hypothetical protein